MARTLTMTAMRLSAEEKWKRCRTVTLSLLAPARLGLVIAPPVYAQPAV